MKRFICFLGVFVSFFNLAAAPECHDTPAVKYCQYIGPVSQIYVNDQDVILMYFDTSIDPTVPNAWWPGIQDGSAGAVAIGSNPEFAKLFYSTALAALMSQKNVNVQMIGSQYGYLKIDRIWLSEQ